MTALLGAAGRAFVKDFMAALLVLGAGIWLAPNLGSALLIALAAIVGSTRAGLKALVVFVPQLSLEHWASGKGGFFAKYAYVGDAAIQALIAGLLTLGVGLADLFLAGDPTLEGAKLFATAGLIALGSAVITAIQGALTRGTYPAPSAGITPTAVGGTATMMTRLAIFIAVATLFLAFATAAWAPPHWFKQPGTHSEQIAAKSPHHW